PSMIAPPPTSTPFPYTTLFRSKARLCRLHRFATKVRRLADMQTQIVPLGLDPIDLAEFQKNNAACFPDGQPVPGQRIGGKVFQQDRKSTRLNSSHVSISYAVFC